MRIWVDADACPGDVKELLYRAADKRKVTMIFVANQPVRTPRSEYLSSICVPGGMNMADRHIVDQVVPGDLVITADIPLAAAVIDKGAEALEFRGELFTATSIGERLAARNLLDQLRGGGLITGGPAAYSSNDRQAFANQFDRWLTKKR